MTMAFLGLGLSDGRGILDCHHPEMTSTEWADAAVKCAKAAQLASEHSDMEAFVELSAAAAQCLQMARIMEVLERL